MTAFVALLRGINVGGRNLVRMADLVSLCEEIGLADVRTYVQSGNVVFTTKKKPEAVATALERAVAKHTGLDVAVAVRTAAGIRSVIKKNPFPEMARSDPGRLLVMFLTGPPTAADRSALKMKWDGPEEWKLVGSDLFITYPDGIGRSKLNLRLKTPGTGRNWKTVMKLADMVDALEAA